MSAITSEQIDQIKTDAKENYADDLGLAICNFLGYSAAARRNANRVPGFLLKDVSRMKGQITKFENAEKKKATDKK